MGIGTTALWGSLWCKSASFTFYPKTTNGQYATPGIIPRGTILVIGIMLLFTPVFILVVTLGFLVVAHGLVLGELSTIELVELYLLELLLLGGFALLLYRVVSTALERHLSAALDELEHSDRDGEPPENEAM